MILISAAIVWIVTLLWALLRRRHSDVWRDVLALGLIGIATGAFFWRLLFTRDVWMPAGGGDLAQFLFPTYSFAADSWRQGVIPLWNPHLFGGAPFVGDSQSGIFYPINLLTFFLSSPLTFRDMEYLSVLHYAIAGGTMYSFLRWGGWGGQGISAPGNLSRWAALAGAVAFEFSDLFITHFGNLNLIAVASWMPLVLLFYRRACTDRRAGMAALAGVVLAVAFFAGHPQAFLFIVLGLVIFGVFHAVESGRADGGRRTAAGGEEKVGGRPEAAGGELQSPNHLITQSPNRPITRSAYFRTLAFLALTALTAVGLSAPYLLPVLEMAQRTVRTSFPYEQAAQYSLPPAQLIGLFVPGFFGRGPQNAWGPWERVEVGYIGILPLVLAFLALVLRRDLRVRWFGVLALVGLGLALGGYAVLHGWLYQFAPGFGQLRAPARFVFLFDFSVATLAAIGLDTLLHSLPRPSEIRFKRMVRVMPWVFLVTTLVSGSMALAILILGQGQDAVLFKRIANAVNGVGFFILLLGLALGLIAARATGWLKPRVWAVLALTLIFFDLFSLGAYVDVSTDNPTQVYDHPDAIAFFRNEGSLFRVDARETGVDRIWPADTSILHHLYDVNGDNPLVLADFDRFWQSLGSRSSVLYDLLNTKYLIGRKNVPLDRAKFQLVYDVEPAMDIYENTHALPRAFVVPAGIEVADSDSALAAIHAPDFDPSKTAAIENGRAPSVAPIAVSSGTGSGSAKITGYGPNEILVNAESADGGVLVLSEVFYPGWRAWIDNTNEVQVLRTDFLLRGVILPPGAHRVRFLYDPGSFKIGVILFAVTCVGIAAWGAWTLANSRRESSRQA